MSVASAVLGVLGMAPLFEEASTLITATKDGVEGVNALKDLLSGEDGAKFKKRMIELLGGTKIDEKGVVTIDAKKEDHAAPKGKWVPHWDSFQGWVYKWEEGA